MRDGASSGAYDVVAMAFFVMHIDGRHEREPSEEQFGELLDELIGADDEHPDVGVQHESGWALSFFRSGRVVLEDVENDEARSMHLKDVARVEALALMRELARGDVALVRSRPWRDGYG